MLFETLLIRCLSPLRLYVLRHLCSRSIDCKSFSLPCWTSVSLDFSLCACLSPLCPPFRESLFWSLNLRAYWWGNLHQNHPLGVIWFAVMAGPLLWRLPTCPDRFLFFHPETNYVSSLCRRWSRYYFWTKKSSLCVQMSLLLDSYFIYFTS